MTPQSEPAPEPPERPITASVTVSGSEAQILRDLAAVLGRTPEELAIEHAAGVLPIPSEPIVDWALFDGPSDLAADADDWLLRQYQGHALGLADAVNAVLAWRLQRPAILSFDHHYRDVLISKKKPAIEVFPNATDV
ncbi:hypothetical protein ACFRMQ_00840 [Kitasatospora sp. NPDC056783]|uniref:hypothetical protein n=1 Tax=Kitasatospora sp. NPDC056783 TaxID=3345943 RepID=UPI0036C8C7F0